MKRRPSQLLDQTIALLERRRGETVDDELIAAFSPAFYRMASRHDRDLVKKCWEVLRHP